MSFDLQEISGHFNMSGNYIDGARYGTGHIHDTFRIEVEDNAVRKHYILQRINHYVFKEPAPLMQNIRRVTEHIRQRIEANAENQVDRRCLTLVPTHDDSDFYRDPEDNYWRSYIFVENASTYDIPEDRQQVYEAASAFGRFQHQLEDLPSPPLNETIPDFHNTRKRFNDLLAAIEKDSVNRAASVKPEIDFVMEREDIVDVLLELNRNGSIPARVTHNDTKLNNVMIDDKTQKGICVIDLDTVMPGLSLYDFGDLVRYSATTAAEDERDLSKVTIDMPLFESAARGYLDSARDILNDTEMDHLVFSGRLISLEIGMRFLADYLDGDLYFKAHREGQNIDRTRAQLRKVRSIEEQEPTMRNIIARI